MPPELHFDPTRLDFGRVVADQEAIRRVNPQRHEMEQLTAIVHVDTEQHLVAGYKDVDTLKKDKDLHELQDRTDFKKLIADLEANQKELPAKGRQKEKK